MIKVCAIMATYNEGDIILESVRKLIDQGVDVYVIDNGSSDNTCDQLAPFIGRGVVDIEHAIFTEDGKEVYNWSALLELKEQVARKLGYDWFLHVDADEIRYSPWTDTSLQEGLDRVDKAGFNLVNFKLFNFRLTSDLSAVNDFESAIIVYSRSEIFNQRQVKAWKSSDHVSIAKSGGHMIRIPDPQVYPTRFILKHYPVRSLFHGQQKIIAERKARFTTAERQRGWHVQYDHLNEIGPKEVFYDKDALTQFNLEHERLVLFEESNDVLCGHMIETRHFGEALTADNFFNKWSTRLSLQGIAPQDVSNLLSVAQGIINLFWRPSIPEILVSNRDAQVLTDIVHSLARLHVTVHPPP